MEKVTFEKSKDNSLTCSINGKYLHSRYRPLQEAENYINNLDATTAVQWFIFTEPCLSYTAELIKKKYPHSKLLFIRYSSEFDSYNGPADKVIYSKNGNISSSLISVVGERNLLKSFFIQWQPAESAFPAESQFTWEEIKKAVEIARITLFTNGYFSKRWFLNTVKNLCAVKSLKKISSITGPVIIAASGNSLNTSIPLIKKIRNQVVLICLSSATKTLLSNSIIPDLVLSTDGGFWAKAHLEPLLKEKNITLALASEGNCGTKILKNSNIVLLDYKDGISGKLIECLGLDLTKAERNGTVSGTGSQLAAALSDSTIYFCGLDLHTGKGFQHTQPNILEISGSTKDNRINPKEKRLASAEFNSSSLQIYEDWFKSDQRKYKGKVYRLSDNYPFENNLNTVQDVNFDFFEKNEINTKKPGIKFDNVRVTDKLENRIMNFVENQKDQQVWLTEFFPGEMLVFEKSNSQEDKDRLKKEITEKNKKFIEKIRKLTDADL